MALGLLAVLLAAACSTDAGGGAHADAGDVADEAGDASTDTEPPGDADDDALDAPFDGDRGDLASDPDSEANADVADDGDATADAEADLEPACEPTPVPVVAAPGLLWDGDLDALTARVAEPPFDAVWASLRGRAQQPPPEGHDAPSLYQRGNIAKAAALVGLFDGDDALLEKARDLVTSLPQTMTGVLVRGADDDIHVADALVGHAVALHLLQATGLETEAAAQALVGFADAFYEYFSFRDLFWGYLPNNHTTKSAAALGLVALVVPDAAQSATWLRYAAAQLAYLWQDWLFSADGAYAEGPGYNTYASITTLPFVVALDRALALNDADGLCGLAVCAFRQYDTSCVDGAEWAPNLLDLEGFRANLDWTAHFVRPDGTLPPYDDTNPTGYPAGAIAGPAGHAELAWMFERWHFTSSTADLGVETLLTWDDDLAPTEPSALELWLPEAGTAARRTGWGADDRYVFLLAEPSAVQRAGHEHADGLSLTVFDRGRPRLIDSGYSQYSDHDAVNRPEQHDTVFIDGVGTPLPLLLADDNPPAELVGREADTWVAAMDLPAGRVTRTVRFVEDGTLEVSDHATFAEPGSHTLSARWHSLGGLTAEEDDRGVFEPTEHGGRWTVDGVATVVDAPSAAATHDLQHDGLRFADLRQHRCVVVSVDGEGEATLTSRLWIGDEGEQPPW